MMDWLRKAAKTIREENGASAARVAVERDVGESTVRRFESGTTTEIDVDSMIAAYSSATGVPWLEFWRRAIEMAQNG